MKCGLEIHQRIDSRKLFCSCNADVNNASSSLFVNRLLHPSTGETGFIDPAVLFESLRDKSFTYEVSNNSCLVDLDEEPPHGVNNSALLTALSVAKHLKMFIPDQLHVMRKAVIDGSNTGGFQRTMVVGLGTKDSIIPTSEGPVRVKDLELEEESARIISRDEVGTKYSLAGLGVPLIEIGTHADIKSPVQAFEVAKFLGELLRLTNNAKRGIGTIRQDVNVSVDGGARVEVKGFQELKDLPRLIEFEVLRQEVLIDLIKSLHSFEPRKVNVTKFFDKSRLFKGKKFIIGVVLSGFKGLLARKLNPVKTLGSELADYARAFGVKGLIHEDEDLGKYGLIEEFVSARNALGLRVNDLLLIIGGDDEVMINKAVNSVMERADLLNERVPEETRIARPDCSSSYARPLPGSSRMYPETDTPVIIPPKVIPAIQSRAERFSELRGYGLADDLINDVLLSPKLDLFKSLINEFGLDPRVIAKVLFIAPREAKRRFNVDADLISDERFIELVKLISEGVILVDVIPRLIAVLCDNPLINVDELIKDYRVLSDLSVKALISKFKSDGLSGDDLFKAVMREVNGRASSSKVRGLM